MNKMVRFVAPLLMAGAMTVSMTGYSYAASKPVRTSGHGVFTFYTIDDGAGFDPALFSWDGRQDSIGIFEGLVHFNKGFSIAPGIATHWKQHGTTWTFYLRHNARFSNGAPVTAQDFVYSWRRAINPATAAAAHHSSSFLGDVPLKNAQKILDGAAPVDSLGVKATGTYSLQVTLDHPDPTLLTQLATDIWDLPVDPNAVQGQPISIWTNPQKIVSDGPYMLTKYVQGTEEVLKPNPYYFGKVPLKEIKILPYSATSNELLTFEGGQSDTAILTAQDVPNIQHSSLFAPELHWTATAISYTLQVSPSLNPALLNLKVRQAFAESVDKSAISKAVLLGTGVPAMDGKITTWLAPWMAQAGLQYNPTHAQQLMAQAGYPNGKGFPTVHILTGSNPDPIAEAVQQMWEQTLGVKVVLDAENYGTYIQDSKQVLPANEVGFTQVGQGPNFPNWETTMPLGISGWQRTNVPKLSMNGAAQVKYQKLQASSLPAAEINNQTRVLIDANETPQVKAVMEMGVKAGQTGNTALMKKYLIAKNHLAYVVPIYTVNNALLIRSDVHGYYPMRMWLVTPPLWLGYITK